MSLKISKHFHRSPSCRCLCVFCRKPGAPLRGISTRAPRFCQLYYCQLYTCTISSRPCVSFTALQLYNCQLQIYATIRGTRKWPVEKFKVATTSIKAVKCSNAIFRLPAWLHPAKFGLYFPSSSSSSLYTCKIFISTAIYILVSRRYCRHYILEKRSIPYKKKEVMLLYNQEGVWI